MQEISKEFNRTLPANIWDIFLPEKLIKTRGLSMEVCFLIVEKAPFGDLLRLLHFGRIRLKGKQE